MRKKISQEFYSRSALACARDLLGKTLVKETANGRVSGIVCDTEAYPAFVDKVHHGNKRTIRTEIMWGEGGYVYVYLIYGVWHQFGVVVGKNGSPDMVLVRAVIPKQGENLMSREWLPRIKNGRALCDGPGKLCKSFGITRENYGESIFGEDIFFEDTGREVPDENILQIPRVGISPRHEGYDLPFRFVADIKSGG